MTTPRPLALNCCAAMLAIAAAAPGLALAQDAGGDPPPPIDEASPSSTGDEATTIVVQGTRIRGQLFVEQPPIAEFDEEDIAALGAGSVADLLTAIAPATQSGARGGRGGGQPVVLINGIRTSGFREIRSYPPEAVQKVEVFSEEVAQRFGFSPDQRVVNIVLKPNFRTLTAEVEYEQPDRGGYSRNEQEVTYLRIGEKGRLNLSAEVEDTSLLTEAERGLTIGGDATEAPFRSLIADAWSAQLTANYAAAVIETGTSLTLSGTYGRDEARSLAGLSADGIAGLERRFASDAFSLGGTVNQPLGDWTGTFTLDANHTRALTEIDRRQGGGFDEARSRTTRIDSRGTVTGYPIALPAGDVTVTFDAGLDWVRIASDDSRASSDLSLTRRRLDGGINVAVPIAERGGSLGAVGDVSLSLAIGAENLSDFGTLGDWSAGITWAPFEKLALTATRIWREVAPSLTNLGAPRIEEFNVPVFDYRSGDTVPVTLVTGGNPALLAETQADWKLGANWQLPFWDAARLQVEYGINRSRDVTATPGFGAAFEAAFPDRVIRGAQGELLAIDRRPLTLFRTQSRIVSFGINAGGQIGRAPPRAEGQGGGPPTAGAGPAGSAGGSGSAGAGAARFDPARFAELREKFCNTPAGETPDLSALPEGLRARLLDEAGNPDPVKIDAARAQFCGEAGAAQQQQFAAVREALCADPPRLDGLPEDVLARLKREDGTIDPERLAAFRARLCRAEGAAAAPPAQGGGGRRGGGGFGRFGGDPSDKRPRYFLSLNHIVALENEVQLGPNGPVFDQLAGDVIAGGAIARDTSVLEAGLFWQGYGLRLSGRYTGEAVLRAAEGSDTDGDLFYGDLASFDVRLFADLGEITKAEDGWLKGLRVSLIANNVFDGRRRVVDGTGTVPDAFAPFRIDPTGRYLGIDVRKAF